MPYNLQIRGWTTPLELNTICQWAEEVPAHGLILEIGAQHGRTAYCWATSCHPTVGVQCVDKWHGRPYIHHISDDVCDREGFPRSGTRVTRKSFCDNVGHLSNILPPMSTVSPYYMGWSDRNIDLLFLDTNPIDTNHWDNIEYWLPFIKQNGILCGHDYSNQFPLVIENVNRLEKLLGTKVTIIEKLWRFYV